MDIQQYQIEAELEAWKELALAPYYKLGFGYANQQRCIAEAYAYVDRAVKLATPDAAPNASSTKEKK